MEIPEKFWQFGCYREDERLALLNMLALVERLEAVVRREPGPCREV